jgi:hypothetical protein
MFIYELSRNAVGFQIRLKRFGDFNAAVRLLMSFNQSYEQPRQRRAAAV